jgi:hypothetical protein
MTDEPTCTIDPERPCRSCLAPGPWACPYPYLLADSVDPDDAPAGQPSESS